MDYLELFHSHDFEIFFHDEFPLENLMNAKYYLSLQSLLSIGFLSLLQILLLSHSVMNQQSLALDTFDSFEFTY